MMLSRIDDLITAAMSRFFYALPLCFIAGALASLAMPPLNAWFILPFSFAVFYLALYTAPHKRSAFLRGWVFGFGYFAFGLSWIGNALLVEGNDYKWAWPLAVSALPAGLALFTAFSSLIIKAFANLKSTSGFFAFVGIFSLFEWLRGHLFTGFPWNLFGYSWAQWPAMTQGIFLSDTYMLSLLTVLWASVFGFALLQGRKAFPAGVICLISFAFWLGYGQMRLMGAEDLVHENVQVRVIQPNIDQSEKWQRDKMAGHFAKMVEMSRARSEDNVTTYIVWPESALSYWIAHDAGAMGSIRQMLYSYPENAVLYTGMLRRDPVSGGYFNSLVAIDKAGQISNIYDKSHLVPFGEYIPFQQYIPLKPVAQFTGFQTGSGPQSFSTPEGLSYSPLVCYEVLFPHNVVATGDHPDFIINVTNDGWYGRSAGPYQHLAITQFRAVESGVTVLRSANTGISAVISPYGAIIRRGKLFETDILTTFLPQKTSRPPLSDKIRTFSFLLIALGFSALSLFKKRS